MSSKDTWFKKGQISWNKGKKSSEGTRRKISESRKGDKNWMWGKPQTIAHRNKISKALKGREFNSEWRENISKAKKGKQLGENGPNWKGGITKLIDRIKSNFKYRQWRSDVFTRDNFTCQECGRRGGDKNAHHIESLSFLLEINDIKTLQQALSCEELWNINNGITFCVKCHRKEHKQLKIGGIKNGYDGCIGTALTGRDDQGKT